METGLISLREAVSPPCRPWLAGLPDEHARTMAVELESRAKAAQQCFRLLHLPNEMTKAGVIGRTATGVVFMYSAGRDAQSAQYFWLASNEVAMRQFPLEFRRQMHARNLWIAPPELAKGDEWTLERGPDGRIIATVTPRLPEDEMPDVLAYLARHSVPSAPRTKGGRGHDEDEGASAPLALRPVFSINPKEGMQP